MAIPKDIDQIIEMLKVAFPNFHPDEMMTKEVYWRLLNDIPSEELKNAVLYCVSDRGRAFAPSIGEIRGAVSNLRRMIHNVPSVYDAWKEVLTQMSENGGDYGNPVWSHPLIERAVRSLGWRNLRMSENQSADRARFIQFYEELLERASIEDIMLPEVRGYIEANGARLLAPIDEMGLLAKRLSVRNDH